MKRILCRSGLILYVLWAAISVGGCQSQSKKDAAQAASASTTDDTSEAASEATEEDDPKRKPVPLVELDTGYEVNTLWSFRVGAGFTTTHRKLKMAMSRQRIYAADVFGVVEARRLKNGQRVWQTHLPNQEGSEDSKKRKRDRNTKPFVSGGPGVSGDLLFFGTVHGEVIALNQKNGAIKWRVQLSSEVLSAPQANDRFVFAQTVDGKLSALEPKRGSRIWNYDNPVPRLSLRGTAEPVASGGRVIAGFASGKLSVVSADRGQLIWEKRVALPEGRSELDRIVDIDAAPLVIGELIYAASYQGRITAFRSQDGAVIWEQEFSTTRDLAHGFGQIYAVDEKDRIVALDDTSGDSVWVNDALLYRQLSAPVAVSNYLLVGDKQGYLHVLSQSDGRLLARSRIDPKGIWSTPVNQGSTVYVLGASGELAALQIRSPK